MSKKLLVLVNTGSPSSPEPDDVAMYLREFLGDPMVVPMPGLLWKPLLNWCILPKRKYISAERYGLIWTKDGSPLKVYTQAVAHKLAATLGDSWSVVYAMRYGQPSLREVFSSLKDNHYDAIYVMPMYAQEAAQTTGSIWNAVEKVLRQDAPKTESATRIAPWFSESGYIEALAQSVRNTVNLQKTHLVMSFHGLPLKGSETYVSQIRETTRSLVQALHLSEDAYSLSFQSKFGHGKWLGPTTENTLISLAQGNVKSVAVVCPGFSVDCLETLEEVAIGLKQSFISHGGESFTYVPALNDGDLAVKFYTELIKRYAKE